jgi:Zn-dependent protease
MAYISREASSPRIEFLIALLGPLCSIFLGILFLGLSFAVDPLSIHIALMMSWLFLMNMAVGIFNLIPGFHWMEGVYSGPSCGPYLATTPEPPG